MAVIDQTKINEDALKGFKQIVSQSSKDEWKNVDWGNVDWNQVGDRLKNLFVKEETPAPSFEYKGFTQGGYQESDAVKQAQAMLQNQMANKPGQYTSPWQAQLNDTIQKILNREKFDYDLNGDALYQQYKDQYTTQGKMAMMDTMGQAAAMTGGYGNSYAQGVGQQAYQGYLQQMNDRIPELYQLALSKYQMEGDALNDQFAILAGQEEKDYGRHRDEVADWQAETDRLQGRYDAERDFDYGKYADERNFAYGQYSDDRNLAYDNFWNTQNMDYQKGRDEVADSQWQKEFDEAVRQFNFENSLGEFAPVETPSSSSGSGTGGNSNYAKTEDMLKNGGYNAAQMLQIVRSSPLSKSQQEKLIEQYRKPKLKQEVSSNNSKRDTSAYYNAKA